MEECATCKFFRRGKDAYGQCVRFPIPAEKHQSEYCGEYVSISAAPLREPAKPKR
jgi:hypothetical protein